MSDELTAPFWHAAAEGRLVVPCCDACGTRFFAPQVACPACFTTAWRWVGSPGIGTVYSATTVHRPAGPSFASIAPYALALVDLDDGWSMLSHVVDRDGDGDVPIGTRVEVCFRPLPSGVVAPVFARSPGAETTGGH